MARKKYEDIQALVQQAEGLDQALHIVDAQREAYTPTSEAHQALQRAGIAILQAGTAKRQALNLKFNRELDKISGR